MKNPTDELEEENKFGVPSIGIPAEVLFHPELSSTEKLLFGLIRNLAQGSKGCYATNNYLGAFLNTGKQTISNGIAILKIYKFINIEMVLGNQGQTIRHIFINEEYPKIYKQMVCHIHDIMHKKNSYAHIKKFIGGDIKKFIGAYKKIGRKDVKKDASMDDVNKKLSKDSCVPPSSSGGVVSMKNKILSKVRKSRPRPRKRKHNPKTKSKIKYQTKQTSEIIQYWNRQPLLKRKFRISNPPTKIYRKTTQTLYEMMHGTLHKRIPRNILAEKINPAWFTKKWTRIEIKKAISLINEMCKSGNQPENKEWLKKLTLDNAIFNPRTGNSVLMKVFHEGVTPIFNPLEKLKTDTEKKAFELFYDFFDNLSKKPLSSYQQKQIVELIQSLSGLREKYPHMWTNPDVAALSRLYISFLIGNPEWTKKFTPREDLTPRGLRYKGWVWNEFVQACFDSLNKHPISGLSENQFKSERDTKSKTAQNKRSMSKEEWEKRKKREERQARKEARFKEKLRLKALIDKI